MNRTTLYRLNIYRGEAGRQATTGPETGARLTNSNARGSEAGRALVPGLLADTFAISRRFRILEVNDDCRREKLCLMADTSISDARVARELDALVRLYGKPT